MPSPKIHNKVKVKINRRHTPDTFVRRGTYITFDYIASFQAGYCTVWQACHAVLNASAEGCLPTDELESAIRSHYPAKDFQRNTLSQKLSQSEDFAQVFPGGKAPGRWFLTGETRGGERNTVNGFYLPNTFVRQYTYITFGYITSLRSNDISVWKACHAILNASAEGCLTTDEIETAIRLHYPEKDFQRTTLSNYLSHSEDFSQVFLEGKTPGRWFLTGEARGIRRANASGRTPNRSDSDGTSYTSASDRDVATVRDSPLILESPFPTTPDSHTIGYQSDASSPGTQIFEDVGQNRNRDFGSQHDTGPLRNMTSVSSCHSTGDELPSMIDSTQEWQILSPEQAARQVLLPTESSSSNMLAAHEQVESLLQKPSGPDIPNVARQGGPEADASELPNVAKPMACGAMIAQQPLPLAYHTMTCWICNEACPADNWNHYHSLVSGDGIPFELPRRPVASREQPEAGAEIPTAGVQSDASLGFLRMDMDF
ncbi:hypothetical protein M407DRAFT_226787 [Tulasnella calospora MUT 4182]|uniref:Uncharacterized protein n=1 Tax=Tulasnella calospora MUT 4182 TaxID=1051891 RepID=A0A0C3L6Z5_9AGAM|nr:hypothetical protein M407DRAFT_226787 [Tulasnella calospora MUT 4182]